MAETEFAVRRLGERDLDEWLRLRKLLWDENDDSDHRTEMLDIIGHPDTQLVMVAERVGGGLVGFLEVSVRPFVEYCETENVGYLEGWFVERAHRQKGIGGELVRAAEKWARQIGCTEMASDTEVQNEKSIAAHLRLGYKETSRLVHFRRVLD